MSEENKNYPSFYDIILYNSFDVTAIVDKDGITQYKSPSIRRIFGYEPEELIGQPSHNYIHPDDLEELEEATKSIEGKPSGSVEVSCRYLHKDGTYRQIEAKIVNELENPHIKGFVLNYQDVTEKKELLEEIKQQQEHLDLSLRGSELGIWDWNLKTGDIFYNERWAGILNYDLSEVQSQEKFWENQLHKDDYERVIEALDDHLNGKSDLYEEEYRLKNKSGGYRWILDRGRVMTYDKEGDPVRVAGTHLDITVKKATEEKLKLQAKELMKINNELENFAYVTSHNLRSPSVNLNALLNYFDKEQVGSSSNLEIWNKIEQSVKQLNTVINDMAEIVALKKDLSSQVEVVKFEEIVQNVIYGIGDDIEKSGATINIDFQQPTISYPVNHIESFVLNMLTNSIKYRKQNRPLIIDIKTFRERNYIVLDFKDNGIGIDLEKYGDKIFKMHQRFHQQASGNGLGLYIVKKQLETLNGKIEVKSEPAVGTEFKLYLLDQNK